MEENGTDGTEATELSELLVRTAAMAEHSYIQKNRKSTKVVDLPFEDQIRWAIDRLKERLT